MSAISFPIVRFEASQKTRLEAIVLLWWRVEGHLVRRWRGTPLDDDSFSLGACLQAVGCFRRRRQRARVHWGPRSTVYIYFEALKPQTRLARKRLLSESGHTRVAAFSSSDCGQRAGPQLSAGTLKCVWQLMQNIGWLRKRLGYRGTHKLVGLQVPRRLGGSHGRRRRSCRRRGVARSCRRLLRHRRRGGGRGRRSCRRLGRNHRPPPARDVVLWREHRLGSTEHTTTECPGGSARGGRRRGSTPASAAPGRRRHFRPS